MNHTNFYDFSVNIANFQKLCNPLFFSKSFYKPNNGIYFQCFQSEIKYLNKNKKKNVFNLLKLSKIMQPIIRLILKKKFYFFFLYLHNFKLRITEKFKFRVTKNKKKFAFKDSFACDLHTDGINERENSYFKDVFIHIMKYLMYLH